MAMHGVSKLLIFAAGLFAVCCDVRAVGLEFDEEFENDAVKAAVLQWSNDALEKLPPSLHDRFPGKIRVRFRSMGKAEPLSEPYCTGAETNDNEPVGPRFETYGRYNTRRNIITINSRLLGEIQLGAKETRDFDCYHGNFYRLATATLLHEIAHAYDALDLDTSINRSAKRSRLSSTTVSGDPSWTVTDGFHTRLLGFRHATNKNRDLNRLPSAHSSKSKRESFATHFEYFLLDADYSCRFPSHNEYFEDHFGWAPDRSNCQSNYGIASQQGIDLTDLNPERIYQIRYLLAARGQKAESRFGHSMLHFVLCAPGTAIGRECLEQEEQDIVLSFAARVDDSRWRALKGVVGSYDSMLFFTSLQHKLQEYNHFEMRDVVSHPIDLSREQIQRLTLRAIELYWTYRSPYRIFSINCATETEDLLKAGILDESYIYGNRRTPKGVLRRLHKTGHVLKAEAPLIYESDFDLGASAMTSLYGSQQPRNRKALQRQIDKLSVEQRRRALEQLETKLEAVGRIAKLGPSGAALESTMRDIQELGKQLESFRFLEGIIAHQQDKTFADTGLAELQRLARRDDTKEVLLERFKFLLTTMQAGDRDSRGGYGIPLLEEIGPDRAELGREFDEISRQVFALSVQNEKYSRWQEEKYETESLAQDRYRLLIAYADAAQEVRTEIMRQALARNPEQPNAVIRSMLEEQYGKGSFETTRFSDARIDSLREAGGFI